MSIRNVIWVLFISAEVMALSACSVDGPTSVVPAPVASNPVDPPLASAPSSGGHNRGFIWSPESGLQVIPQPSYAQSMFIEGINNHGQVIGDLITHDGEENFHAFLWTANDGLQRLGSLVGAEGISRALTIDDDGVVRGLSEGPSTTYFIALHLADAFVWTAAAGMKPTTSPLDTFKPVGEGGKLILPAGADCMKVVRTTTTGLAVGYGGSKERGACRTWVALMWESDGAPVVIARCETRCASVSDINTRGEVVGYEDGGFRWTRSGGLVPLPIEYWPVFINDNGDVVASTVTDEPSPPFVRPQLLMASGEIKTIDLPPGTTWVYLTGINNSGQVVGTFR